MSCHEGRPVLRVNTLYVLLREGSLDSFSLSDNDDKLLRLRAVWLAI